MDCRYQLILKQMSKMSDGLCHNSAGIVLLTRQEMRKDKSPNILCLILSQWWGILQRCFFVFHLPSQVAFLLSTKY